jgi:Rrf2 family iron-sulfur cluster assembly transcriptional regulator
MRLSTKGRYAVMAMTDLAKHGGEAGAVTLAAIAGRQEISLAYLEQLFARLRRAGLVKSARGPGGGYRLANPAGETFIGDIVKAVDEPMETTRCGGAPETGCMSSGERCLTHGLWDALGRRIEDFLAGVSLEDVVERRLDTPASSSSVAA